MDRKHLIEQLVRHELVWLHENFDVHNLTQVSEFFTEGGFENWSDKELLNKYDAVYGEEV